MLGANRADCIEYCFLDLNKDGRKAKFYNWYSRSAVKGKVMNEDSFRTWALVF